MLINPWTLIGSSILYHSIMKNDVWEIVPRPKEKSIVTSHWLYKLKHVADGSVEKYKARFVARGFSKVEGIDYDETFASVARYTSIKALISLQWKWVGRSIRWI